MAALAQEFEQYVEDSVGLWSGNFCVTDKVTDELLATAYIRFKAEGLLPYLFYENDVAMPSLTWFIEQFSSHKMEVLACIREDENKKMSFGGLTWLLSKTNVGTKLTKAECGQGFFISEMNRSSTTKWGKLSTEFAFRYLGVNLLIGTTPAPNRAAVIALKRVGFRVSGIIPGCTLWQGKPCDAVVSYMTKDLWRTLNYSEAI